MAVINLPERKMAKRTSVQFLGWDFFAVSYSKLALVVSQLRLYFGSKNIFGHYVPFIHNYSIIAFKLPRKVCFVQVDNLNQKFGGPKANDNYIQHKI